MLSVQTSSVCGGRVRSGESFYVNFKGTASATKKKHFVKRGFVLNDLWFIFYHKMNYFKEQHIQKFSIRLNKTATEDGEICFWRGSKSYSSLLFRVEK
jgi:hypothetical protein